MANDILTVEPLEKRGPEDFRRRLLSFSDRVANQVSGRAVRSGLKLLAQVQRRAVARKWGILARSIAYRFRRGGRKYSERDRVRAKSGINVGKEAPQPGPQTPAETKQYRKVGKFAYHGHLWALGTLPRWRGIKYGRKKVGKRKEYFHDLDDFSPKFKRGQTKVAYTGIMPPNAILGEATRQAEPQARSMMIAELNRGILEEHRKSRAS